MYLYRKFFIIFILLSSLFLSLIFITNYYIDEGNQFYYSNVIENKIANILLNKKSVMIHVNYNDRLLQREMLKNLAKPPEVLVLGSSHTMPINHEVFINKNFYNASVSGGYLEDDIALYYALEKRGWRPKVLIICLDPWIINKKFATLFVGDNIQLWKSSLAQDFFAAKYSLLNVRISSWNSKYQKIIGYLEKYSQLISLDYVKGSFRQMKSFGFGKNKFGDITELSVKNSCPNCNIKNPDGSTIPSQNSEALSGADVDALTVDMLSLVSTFYENFPPLNSENKFIFETFIDYLTQKNIRVVFYFPPLEPIAYKRLFVDNNNYQSMKIVEKYFISLAAKHNFKIIGSYDPNASGLTSSDFIDMWHIKTKGMRKIFIADDAKNA